MHNQRLVRHTAVPSSAPPFTLRTEIKLGDQPQTAEETTAIIINLGPEAYDGTKCILALKEEIKNLVFLIRLDCWLGFSPITLSVFT
jgi:hypothetical protein